jgi:hypothetical protein
MHLCILWLETKGNILSLQRFFESVTYFKPSVWLRLGRSLCSDIGKHCSHMQAM